MKLKVLICIKNNLELGKFILGLIEEFYLLPTDYMIRLQILGQMRFYHEICYGSMSFSIFLLRMFILFL